MSIVRYEPWLQLRKFQRDVNRLFHDGLLGETTRSDHDNAKTNHWHPAVDVKKEDDRFILTADLPGVNLEQIKITTDKSRLTIEFERIRKDKEEHQNYRRLERLHGIFKRQFNLPDVVDVSRISAKNRNGVLEVTIPKKEQAQPRRISVAA